MKISARTDVAIIILTASILMTSTVSSPVHATETGTLPPPDAFAPQVADESAAILRESVTAGLKKSYARFNSTRASRKEWQAIFKTLGWSEQDRKAIEDSFGSVFEQASVQARWENDEIVMEAAGNTIEIGASEYFRGTLRVNGAAFRWNPDKSMADNLNAYKNLFSGDSASFKKSAALKLWDHLVPNAAAAVEGLLVIQASGLRLAASIDAWQGRAFMLTEFAKVAKEQTNACKTSKDPGFYRVNLANKAKEASTDPDNHLSGQGARFLRCDDVRRFAKNPYQNHPETILTDEKITDVCKQLTEWSRCVKALLPPQVGTFRDQKGALPNAPFEDQEWQDESSAAPAK